MHKEIKEFKNVKEDELQNIANYVFDLSQKSFQENKGNNFVIFLNGDLGAGKTTFTKYFAKVLGITENVISPTFILRKDYEFKAGEGVGSGSEFFATLIHIDGYRFDTPEEAAALALDKELNMSSPSLSKGEGEYKKIVLIEWAEKFKDYYDLKPDLEINIEHLNEEERDILIRF